MIRRLPGYDEAKMGLRPEHHAGYLENSDGFEVELVANHDP
jgi:hypothetical protein